VLILARLHLSSAIYFIKDFAIEGFLYQDITALTADSYLVFTAAGKDIYAWRRGTFYSCRVWMWTI
jgi:hypothetical protein